MFENWETYFPDHYSGIEVFTRPLREDAAAVIIGYNAGGGDKDANEVNKYMRGFVGEAPDFSLSESGYYQEGGYGYTLAKRIRKYFSNGKTHLLENSVELNRYFLRTEGKNHHRKLLQEIDDEHKEIYENFCRETTRETIRHTNPDVVVDFSGKYDSTGFCEDLNFTCEHKEQYQYTNGKNISASVDVAAISEPPNARVISINPHPSAPTLAQKHLDFFKQAIPPLLPD
jgi:hypothetical protein